MESAKNARGLQKMVCDCGFEAYTQDALEAHLLSHVEESRKPARGKKRRAVCFIRDNLTRRSSSYCYVVKFLKNAKLSLVECLILTILRVYNKVCHK